MKLLWMWPLAMGGACLAILSMAVACGLMVTWMDQGARGAPIRWVLGAPFLPLVGVCFALVWAIGRIQDLSVSGGSEPQ